MGLEFGENWFFLSHWAQLPVVLYLGVEPWEISPIPTDMLTIVAEQVLLRQPHS